MSLAPIEMRPAPVDAIDPAEWAAQRIGDYTKDLMEEIARTTDVTRLIRLQKMAQRAIEELQFAESYALAQADRR